jgi:long-chain acyl-CoA synthetase
LTTFPHLLLEHAARRPQAPALREKDLGIWQTLTWGQLADLVRALAHGLAAAGLQRGEHLVVVGENRPRLYASMLAAQSLGAIPVPLYQDAVAAEFVFPLRNAEARFVIAEDQEQIDKFLEIRAQCPLLQWLWFDDPRGLRNYREPGLASLDALAETGRAHAKAHAHFFDTEVAQVQPGDVAAMFYTSGTTGTPKGVVHTHASLLDRAQAGARFDRLRDTEEVLAYLPRPGSARTSSATHSGWPAGTWSTAPSRRPRSP